MKAFISCSLRKEDEKFVEYIEKILRIHGVESFGTVGRHAASPENPIELIKKNIALSDLVVVCATPRYIQSDVHTGDESNGLSEMIHLETGLALANEKPVLVFAKEGTNLGKVFPHITQYIQLNGKKSDYEAKKGLIASLIAASLEYKVNNDGKKVIKDLVVTGSVVYTGYKLLKYFVKK